MDYKFCRDEDIQLIEQMKKNPALYNAYDIYHKNYIVKHRLWESISEEMKISIPDLKRRWKNLRDHYNKKKKTERDNPNIKNWELMPHLSFLSEVVTQKYCTSNAIEDTENQETEYIEDTENQQTCEDQTTSFRSTNDEEESISEKITAEEVLAEKRKATEVIDENCDKRGRFETPVSKSKQSPLHKFFESMADAVAQFPYHLAAEAKLKVCQVITELEIKMHEEALEHELSKGTILKNSQRTSSTSPSSSVNDRTSFVCYNHLNTDSDSELSNKVEMKTE